MRTLLFYGLSLILSLITIVVAATVFIIVLYINGSVSPSLISLFILVAAINIAILSISVRGVIKLYPLLSQAAVTQRVVIIDHAADAPISETGTNDRILDEKYLTSHEAEIISLLRENSNRMLQNSITSSLPTSKATISRALTSLENKGVIIRVRKGVTNEIILSETYSR